MTMTTKELLAMLGTWRETEAADRQVLRDGGLDGEEQNWHMASAATFKLCADELAPIATALCAEVEALKADVARLDWLDQQGIAYGFEDMHEGNSWAVSGAYANIRAAIDAARSRNEHEG